MDSGEWRLSRAHAAEAFSNTCLGKCLSVVGACLHANQDADRVQARSCAGMATAERWTREVERRRLKATRWGRRDERYSWRELGRA